MTENLIILIVLIVVLIAFVSSCLVIVNGKSAAILCATLAWQRYYMKTNKNRSKMVQLSNSIRWKTQMNVDLPKAGDGNTTGVIHSDLRHPVRRMAWLRPLKLQRDPAALASGSAEVLEYVTNRHRLALRRQWFH